MAMMIGRTKSWLAWVCGAVCALVFGCGSPAGEAPPPVYGMPRPSPEKEPAKAPEKPPAPANLEDSREWKTIIEAWDFARPLADSGKSTTRQRKEADEKLKAAAEAAAVLAGLGLLNTSESGLLSAEADKLKADICREQPTDSTAKCYETMAIQPAQQSFDRLAARLPLLRRLVAESKLHKPAVEKVLATIEADVATLSDEKKLAEIKDADKRADAERIRDSVKTELDKLKKQLPGTAKE
jgi:hypothetical protein